jgi:hypothetical protein
MMMGSMGVTVMMASKTHSYTQRHQGMVGMVWM